MDSRIFRPANWMIAFFFIAVFWLSKLEAAHAQAPDLIVTNIGMSPATPVAGDAVLFSATLKNQGTASTPLGSLVTVAFQVDGVLVTWSHSLAPIVYPGAISIEPADGGLSGSNKWTATAGTHTLTAVADDLSLIAESNEGNNSASCIISVGGTSTTPPPSSTPPPSGNSPDLIVSNLTWTPTSPTAGQAIQFTATVKNQGTVATPSGSIISVAFLVDGTLVNWSNNLAPILYPGAISIQSANGGPSGSNQWMVTAGTHTVVAWADDANRIVESDETNNRLSMTLSVAGGSTTPPPPSPSPTPSPSPSPSNLPDLIASNVSWNPANPAAGTPVQFSATVKNQGTVATPSGSLVTVAFLVDGTLVNWSNNLAPIIYPGAISIQSANGGPSGSSQWTVTAGTHTVVAWVDDANRIAESNESNNQLSATLVAAAGSTPPPSTGTAAEQRAAVIRGLRGTYAQLDNWSTAPTTADLNRLLNELVQLHVNTYAFLIWPSASDWDLLKQFLPMARAQGINVIAYLTPPSEQAPILGPPALPYGLDFVRWGQEIAKLSLTEPNLVGWAMDDFDYNLGTFTPSYVSQMTTAAKAINPKLAFTPTVYSGTTLGSAYAGSIDGLLLVQMASNQSPTTPMSTHQTWMQQNVQAAKAIFGASFPVVSYQLVQHWDGTVSSPQFTRDLMLLSSQYADGCLLYTHPLPTWSNWSAIQQTFTEFQANHAWGR